MDIFEQLGVALLGVPLTVAVATWADRNGISNPIIFGLCATIGLFLIVFN